MNKKVVSIITAAFGSFIILLGLISLFFSSSGGAGVVENASFGGDFQTYMYNASFNILSELRQISDQIDTVATIGSMILLAIGLGVLAYGLHGICDAFFTENKVDIPGHSTGYTNTPNYAAPASPAVNSSVMLVPEEERGRMNTDGTWNCLCGRRHSSYVSSCSCGVSKSEIILRNATE